MKKRDMLDRISIDFRKKLYETDDMLSEDSLNVMGQTFTIGKDAIVDKKGNSYGWPFIEAFYKYGKKKGYI